MQSTESNKGLAYRLGEGLYAMSLWSRQTRASIAIGGMLIAIVCMWAGWMFAGVAVGFVALGLFWLILPAEQNSAPTPLEHEATNAESEHTAQQVVHGDQHVDQMTINVGSKNK